MSLPRQPKKHGEAALVTPDASIDHFYDEPPPAPDAAVLCFDDGLFDHVDEAYATTPFGGFGTGYALDETGGTVGVVRVPGVGAPSAALAVEGLIARGCQTLVIVGFAGSLQPDLGVGNAVVIDRALRDEGTSYHYLESNAFIDAEKAILGSVETALEVAGEEFVVGSTWTTDAPYRETGAEVEHFRDEGILTVDMEAAAVFAVATYRDVAAGAVFCVSDVLSLDDWKPGFDRVAGRLEGLLDPVIEVLASDRE